MSTARDKKRTLTPVQREILRRTRQARHVVLIHEDAKDRELSVYAPTLVNRVVLRQALEGLVTNLLKQEEAENAAGRPVDAADGR